jgi:hypothetical protein
VDLPDDAADAPPVLVAAAWLRDEPPVLEAVVLRFGAESVSGEVAAAFRDVAVGLGGSGEVQALDEGEEPLRLVAGVGSSVRMPTAEVAEALSQRATERLSRCEDWPAGAQALVQSVSATQVTALDAALWPTDTES